MKSVVLLMLVAACVHAQAQEFTTEQINAIAACQAAEAKSPEAYRLEVLGIIGQQRPTLPQLENDAYATADDSGMAMMYLRKMSACLQGPPDPIVRTFQQNITAFANGLLTYGETVMLMDAVREKLLQRRAAERAEVPTPASPTDPATQAARQRCLQRATPADAHLCDELSAADVSKSEHLAGH